MRGKQMRFIKNCVIFKQESQFHCLKQIVLSSNIYLVLSSDGCAMEHELTVEEHEMTGKTGKRLSKAIQVVRIYMLTDTCTVYK